jgi:hypothetical protein
MLSAMKRLLVLACVLAIACGKDTPAPTTPTPPAIPLPAGAPSDAAAAPGTSRITITAIEIIGPDGARVTPDKLKVTPMFTSYNMRVWIFCPPGLEGPQGSGWNAETLDYMIRKSDPVTNTGGTFSGGLRLDKGYAVIEASLSMTTRGGQQRVTTEIHRNFVVIARNEFTATFSE